MKTVISFGIIGGGLLGREFASAVSRWMHLNNLNFEPRIVAICSGQDGTLDWFHEHLPGVSQFTTDYHELLANPAVEAVYCAVPHHLHREMYIDILRSGKHLLGEKPFGIDASANAAILAAAQETPDLLVRCSSEFPFYPGAYQISEWIRAGKFGQIIDVEAGFWHSSDLNPHKPLNWKRRAATCGEYGCMGDLGMHIMHIPLRAGWLPQNVRALLTRVYPQRPTPEGALAPTETWDNAILACEAGSPGKEFPLLLSTKRIAPGHANTWFIRIHGTSLSAAFSTRNPKQLSYLPYTPGAEQAWQTIDTPYRSAYPTITGPIFEFGFSDAILQMIAAFCDELINRDKMQQPFYCATPEETRLSHQFFTASLLSHQNQQVVSLPLSDQSQFYETSSVQI